MFLLVSIFAIHLRSNSINRTPRFTYIIFVHHHRLRRFCCCLLFVVCLLLEGSYIYEAKMVMLFERTHQLRENRTLEMLG